MLTSAYGAGLSSARVSQVIQDVRLLPSSAAARPAAVNDNVGIGTAVRTGRQSRAELTFQDLTITRLGENTVFSLKEGTRDLTLDHGSILLQVPAGAPAANIRTAAVTAAVSGGTAIFGTGPPVKFMVMEGVGTFYPAGHPENAVTLHGGEMASLGPDGHLIVQTFNVKLVLETSPLFTQFPDLANLPLILQVQDQQQTDQSNPNPPPSKDIIDVTSENTVANPAVNPPPPPPPSGTPGETGPPPTITTPDPYVIGSGTNIQTDPSITTNGVTDFGTFYRGTALDGTPTEFLFGEEPTSFDNMVFSGSQNNLPVAVFKFSNLELTGDPTVSVPSGGATNLALVAVGTITSGGPGGTLTFAGIDRLSFITQDGSITLGPEISFSGLDHLEFYARGSESNLTLGSAISNVNTVKLNAEGSIQVNGDENVTEFDALAGVNFATGTGTITATTVNIQSLGDINIDGSKFPNPPGGGDSFVLNATNTLNLAIAGGGQPFGWDTLTANATTINLTSATPTTFDFSNSSSVSFTAGTGGINAPNIDFVGSPSNGWSLTSGGSISVHSINTEDATISAATSFTAAGDVTGAFIGSTLTAGTTVDVGGNLFVFTLTAGGNINVGNGFIALTVNAPSSILTVQGNIGPFGGEGLLQYTYNVDSIVAPAGINFSFNGTPDFVGNLTINANTLTFDPATGIAFVNFNGVNANEFGAGSPAEGGNGGTFIVNSAGDITANNGADITATTGLNSAPGIYSGAGGAVTLHSTGGMVTVNDTIQVSSDDSEAPRQSASGGMIDLQSDLTTGTGITVGANGQLLSLLDANAPGPGGSITLSTMGADIVVNGTVEADRGTITIDQSDPAAITAPLITIDGATLVSDTLNITGAGDINVGLNNPVTINVSTLSLSAPGLIQFDYTNSFSVNSFDAEVGGASDAGVNLNFSSDFNDTGDATLQINNEGGTIGSDAVVSLTASNLSVGESETGLLANIDNSFGGSIGGNANVTVNVSGDITTQGDATLQIDNSEGGHITEGAQISLTAGDVDVGGSLTAFINNRDGGSIGSSADVSIDITGSLSTQGDATIGISSRNDGAGGGTVGGDATVNVQANSIAIGGFLESFVTANGGQINGDASLIFNVAGDITSGTGTEFDLQDVAYNGSGGPLTPGIIVGDATLSVTAANLTSGGFIQADILNNAGGHIEGDATLTLNTSGDINGQQGILAVIGDTSFSPNLGPSHIDGDATVTLQAQDIITPSTATGTPGTDTMALEASIYTNVNGVVGGDAIVNVTAAQTISAPGTTLFWVANGNYQNLGPGTIGGNAEVNISAADINTGDFYFQILNYGGSSIGESATLNLTASDSMTVGALNVLIDNSSGGSIGGDATVAITTGGSFSPNSVAASTTGDLTANSLLVQIDNSNGSIGGDATINMNVAATATVTNDATVQILGNDPTGAAAINFNGGTYNVGGTFLSTIDGNGAINFTNANINADTIKAAVNAVSGSNGTLMIGGGSLTANTLMKLYATGSSGAIDFTANVTLTCRAAAIILAANTLTINDNVVVTIGGSFPASVYANIANYSGSGGNGSTTGTFAGAGASNPQPLANAPPFSDPLAPATSATKSSASGSTTLASSSAVGATSHHGHQSSLADGVEPPTHSVTSANTNGTTTNTIKVANSGQLLSVLDSATQSSNGKIMIASSKGDGVSKSPNRTNPGRPNAAPGLSRNRSAADKGTNSKTTIALAEGLQPSVR